MKFTYQNVMAATATATSLYTQYNAIRNWQKRRNEKERFTLTISENMLIYARVAEWLNSQVTGKRFTMSQNVYGQPQRNYDDVDSTEVMLDGHKVKVNLVKPSLESTATMMTVSKDAMQKRIQFSCDQMGGIDAVEALILRLANEGRIRERQVMVNTIVGVGHWEDTLLPKKTIDSVFLPEGVKEALLNDLDQFIEQRDTYQKVGIPWHRGYLLYGEPGNGKSSLVSALAHHYGMDIYNMPLSAVKDDQKLAELVAEIEPKSILLIEDIDIFSQQVKREKDAEAGGPTLAGLLNALDGVSTPTGLITVLTTNEKDKLDRALIRPGRVDYRLELEAPVPSQIRDMYKAVYDITLQGEPKRFNSMAEVANVFKVNLREPEIVANNLVKTQA